MSDPAQSAREAAHAAAVAHARTLPLLVGDSAQTALGGLARIELLRMCIEALAKPDLDKESRLAVEHLQRVACTQRKAQAFLDCRRTLVAGGHEGFVAVAKFELWLSRKGLPAELPVLF